MTNLPNILTLVRILVIPVLVLVYYLPFNWAHLVAAIIFAAACITDWLDGYIARNWKLTTKLGAFLDPVADKIMVSVALVMIVAEPELQFISAPSSVAAVPVVFIVIPAAIIVSREIVVSALREWMAELGKRTSLAVSQVGKIKTTIQMIALVALLYCDSTTPAFIILIGYILLYVAAILTLWSMLLYLKAAWPELKSM